MTTQEMIQSLAETVHDHEALNNDFYRSWMDGPLALKDIEIFARNFLARTENTATMVALSFLGAQDIAAKIEILKNLYSEYGYGHKDKAHIVLLRDYLTDLLSRLAGRPYGLDELESKQVLPTTKDFIREQRQLYTDGEAVDPRRVVGTLLAQEWLAYSMLTRLYEGARNYRHLYPNNDVFHEHCEYFYIHIGSAEKEHKIQAVKAAASECRTSADVEELKASFNCFLTITARYWNGIAAAMSERQSLRVITA